MCTMHVLLCCAHKYRRALSPYMMPSTGSGGNATNFLAQITSYDYSAPISEAGGTGQPGIGGANKFEVQLPLCNRLQVCYICIAWHCQLQGLFIQSKGRTLILHLVSQLHTGPCTHVAYMSLLS